MTNQTHDRSQLIQTYMMLHSQQTNIRRRLSQDSTASSGSESPDSTPSSPSSPKASPVPSRRRSSSRSSVMSSSSPPSRRTSIETIPEIPEAEMPPMTLSGDELKLADVSNKIKTTLTDLINCDGVKGDSRMRNWVATRLMDVEHDIKKSRRMSHSADPAQVDAISASLCERGF